MPTTSLPVVTLTGLTKRFGTTLALTEASLSLRPGEVVGLLGPNGAGKSTLIHCLAGLLRPDAGTIHVAGGTQLGFVHETDCLPLDMRVGSFLRAEAAALGVPDVDVPRALDRAGARHLARRPVGALSLGNRRRAAIAAACLGDRQVLVLDEPTNGLDVDGLRMVRALVAEWRARGGSVLFSSHTLPEVERMADRIVVLVGGRVHFDGRADQLAATTATPNLEDAYESLLSGGRPW